MGKWRGRCGAATRLLTKAWTVVRRRHTNGGAQARSSGSVGSIDRRRGCDDGVGVFHRGGGSFYRAGGGVLRR
jgi:hypothetical protein